MTKEELADQLVAILWPPLEQSVEGWWLDHGVREIEGAIWDIKHGEGRCDEVSLRTLERVSEKLARAAQLAEPFRAPRIPHPSPNGPGCSPS